MTREEARQNLMALGIEEVTDIQVTNYLNQFHANRLQPAPQPTPTHTPTPEQPKLKTDEPKPNENDAELSELRATVERLERENIQKDIRAYASERGLTGEQAQNVLAGFSNDFETAKSAIDAIANIISDKEKAAANAKEQEIAGKATNPGGGSADSKKDEEKPEDLANIEKISFGSVSESAQSARDYYK